MDSLGRTLKLLDTCDDFSFPPHAALDDVQNIATQAAAVSRFFWPVGKKYQARGAALRKAMAILDDNPLKDRKLRNMIEHFDEYLDDFLEGAFAGTIMPEYFGPNLSGERGPLKLFRAFFTDSAEFEILGKTFSIAPLADELVRLHKILIECENAGGRFPRGN